MNTGSMEVYCENHFKVTHSRTGNGRYVVKMPLNTDYENQLRQSKQITIRKLKGLHKRLVITTELLSPYKNFRREYETLYHIEEIKKVIYKLLHTPWQYIKTNI